MLDFVLAFHDGFRWIVLLIGLIALLIFAFGFFSKGAYGALSDRLLGAFSGALVIQFLLGIVLFIVSYLELYRNQSSNSDLVTAITHAVVMIVAVGAGASTGGRAKRAKTAPEKYRAGLIGLVLTFVILIVGITVVGGW